MTFKISKDRSTLTVSADAKERKELRELENIQSDKAMFEFFEPLACNSELDWIGPEETGDLTSAPMLGIKSWLDDYCDGLPKVVSRWAFMDYALRSPLEDLRDTGKAVFIGGDL